MKLLKKIFLNNLPLKLFALVLACLLWFQTSGQNEVQTTVAIPIEFTKMPRDLEIVNDYPKSVNVLINKQGAARLDEKSLSLVVDLRNAQPGIAVLPLTEDNIKNLPSGTSSGDFEQRRLRLQFEKTRRKLVKVNPDIVGQPAQGFATSSIVVYPGEILISGPQSKIEKITSAGTETIDISDKNKTFTQTVNLDLDDISIRIEETSSVDVVVNIEEKRDEVKFRVPVRPAENEERITRINYRTVEITVTKPVSWEGRINPDLFRAFVSVGDELPEGGTQEVVPDISIPDEYTDIVRLKAIRPDKVRITVKKNS